MDFKEIKYLTLEMIAEALDSKVDVICDWLLTNKHSLEFFAWSEFADEFHPIMPESYQQLLAADKKIREIYFKYPKNLRHYRQGPSSLYDRQALTRKELRIKKEQLNQVVLQLKKAIGGITTKKHVPNSLRRTGRNWVENHEAIISAANQLIKQEPANCVNSNGKLVLAKLAKLIDKNREQWPKLADEPTGTSLRKITELLGENKTKLLRPNLSK